LFRNMHYRLYDEIQRKSYLVNRQIITSDDKNTLNIAWPLVGSREDRQIISRRAKAGKTDRAQCSLGYEQRIFHMTRISPVLPKRGEKA